MIPGRSSYNILFLTAFLLFYSCGSIYSQTLDSKELQQTKKLLFANKEDTATVELLLKLSSHYIYKPGEEKSDMDSALMLTRRAELLSQKLVYYKGIAGAYLNYANNYREMGQREKGNQYVDSAILLCKKYVLNDLLGESYIELGQYPDRATLGTKDWLVKKSICFQNALAAFQSSGNKERQGFCLKNLADFSQLSGNYSLAIKQARQALELYKAAGSYEVQGCYDLLNYCYCSFSDYPSAVKYGLLALKAAETAHDTSMQLSTIYNRLGITFSRSRTNDMEAIRYYKAAFEIAEKYNALPNMYSITANIVLHFNEMNRPGEALKLVEELIYKHPGPKNDPDFELIIDRMFLSVYNKLKNFTEAKKRCDRMIINYLKSPENSTYGINDVIRYYLSTKQWQKAEASLRYVDSTILKRERINTAGYLTDLKMWFELDSSRGNYIAAITDLQKYQKAQDSVYDDNKSKMIETLRVEYEMEGKDKDIALLTATSNLQNEELSRSRLVRNITIGGILLLSVFSILLYRQYRHKIQSNRQIANQNNELQHLLREKEWLLKEIHHRVKNNLQTVVSLLESQSAYLQSDALAAIQDSQNRVHAMSLVHQKLYQSENVASINMANYLPELINYLKESLTTKRIKFNISDIAPVDLDVSQAIPIGLIVNEAVSNTIKYAFPLGAVTDTISVSLKQSDNYQLTLSISDNGVGLPEGFDSARAGGLGLRLIKGLTEDIGGIFTLQSERGTTITVSFIANTPFYKITEATGLKVKSVA